MGQKMGETLAQGSGIELCEIHFGPGFFMKPACETMETPQPDFEEVKHLYSDKPLQFYRPLRFSCNDK